jgi:cytochrome c heme-lyase
VRELEIGWGLFNLRTLAQAECSCRMDDIQLARFQGKPGQISPKARFWLFAGWLLPSRFNSEPPFDRHDWIVRRKSGEEVRYVIDYYSAPPDPDGSPGK